jgi:hypothetical protein
VERYRIAGHDLEVNGPRYVPLDIALRICVKPDYFRSNIKAALLRIFSNRTLPDGSRSIFHPDNFTFGTPVYLSQLLAAAQAVEGVESVQVTKFQRKNQFDAQALADGVRPGSALTFGRLEIAQLDNDPNFAERGTFTLEMGGGK